MPPLSRSLSILCPLSRGRIYRRSVFEKLGCLDQEYRFAEDVDLFLRIREQHIR